MEWGGADAIVKEAVNRRTPYGSCCVNCEASRSYGDGEQGEAIRGLNETKNSMGIFVDWA